MVFHGGFFFWVLSHGGQGTEKDKSDSCLAPHPVAGMKYLLLCKVISCSWTLTQTLLFLQLSKYKSQTCVSKVHTWCGFHVELVCFCFSSLIPTFLLITDIYLRKKSNKVSMRARGNIAFLCAVVEKSPNIWAAAGAAGNFPGEIFFSCFSF